jgi:hypothetical protein
MCDLWKMAPELDSQLLITLANMHWPWALDLSNICIKCNWTYLCNHLWEIYLMLWNSIFVACSALKLLSKVSYGPCPNSLTRCNGVYLAPSRICNGFRVAFFCLFSARHHAPDFLGVPDLELYSKSMCPLCKHEKYYVLPGPGHCALFLPRFHKHALAGTMDYT